VEVTPAERLRRVLVRDVALFGSEEAVSDRYTRRYLPAQELYRAAVGPMAAADVVIGNDDPARPSVLAWRPPPAG
jgi:uridine kinase